MRKGFATSRLALSVLAALIVLLGTGAPARADVGETIILRCTHNESLAGFSQKAYQQALKELTADVEEYSSCYQEIRHAQELAASNRPGSPTVSTTGAPLATSTSEQRSLEDAVRSGARPSIRFKGHVIRPGVVHADISSALSTMPTSLMSVLALLAAGLVLFLASTVRRRLRRQR